MRLSAEMAETVRIQQSGARIAALFQASNAQRLAALRKTALSPALRAAVLEGKSNRVADSIIAAPRPGQDSLTGVALIAADGHVISSRGPVAEFLPDIPRELVLQSV